MTVGLKGLFTPPAPETRCVAYLEEILMTGWFMFHKKQVLPIF